MVCRAQTMRVLLLRSFYLIVLIFSRFGDSSFRPNAFTVPANRCAAVRLAHGRHFVQSADARTTVSAGGMAFCRRSGREPSGFFGWARASIVRKLGLFRQGFVAGRRGGGAVVEFAAQRFFDDLAPNLVQA